MEPLFLTIRLAKAGHIANAPFYQRFTPLRKNGKMTALFPRLLPVFGLSVLVCAVIGSVSADPEPITVSQFSGKPVPRFESLRYSAVHGRQGPSLDHPILWRYEKAGLPMLVVRETHGWRRVRDKDGDEVWVQARMLSGDQRVVTIRDLVMYKRPDVASSARARLTLGVIAEIESCELLWCKIKIDRQSGWVEKIGLWGVETSASGL